MPCNNPIGPSASGQTRTRSMSVPICLPCAPPPPARPHSPEACPKSHFPPSSAPARVCSPPHAGVVSKSLRTRTPAIRAPSSDSGARNRHLSGASSSDASRSPWASFCRHREKGVANSAVCRGLTRSQGSSTTFSRATAFGYSAHYSGSSSLPRRRQILMTTTN